MMRVYKWTDLMGKTHKVPEGSCILCEHCSDIFLDPLKNNEVYSCGCSIGKEDEFCKRKSVYDTFCSGYVFDKEMEVVVEDEI